MIVYRDILWPSNVKYTFNSHKMLIFYHLFMKLIFKLLVLRDSGIGIYHKYTRNQICNIKQLLFILLNDIICFIVFEMIWKKSLVLNQYSLFVFILKRY